MIKTSSEIQTTAGKNERLLFVLVFVIVLSSRLPFIGAGYGDDFDSWRVALNARKIATTGEYSVSRFPGYPVQELAYSLIWQLGPLAMNGLTALLSAIAAVFFALILKNARSRDILLSSLALALIPVIYINSTTSIDYIWAFTFIMGALYFVSTGRYIAAGIMLGISFGCRPTSVVMLVPLNLYIFLAIKDKLRLVSMIKFTLISVIAGIIAFSPVLITYGLSFWQYADMYPQLIYIIWRITFGTFGAIGCISVLLAFVIMAIKKFKIQEDSSIPAFESNQAWIPVCLTVIIIYLIIFFRLPHEEGYLIPAIPFILILFSRVLKRKVHVWVCVLLIVSSFVLTVDNSGKHIYGPIISDHIERIERGKYINRLIESVKYLDDTKSVILVGWYIAEVDARLLTSVLPAGKEIEFVEFIDKDELSRYLEDGFKIYYMSDQARNYNFDVNGVDLDDQIAEKLNVE